jgi:hypothetical protein
LALRMSSWVDSVLDSQLPWTDPGPPLGVERLGLIMPGYTGVKIISEIEGKKADENNPGHSIRLAFSEVPHIIHKYAAGYNK